MTSSNGPSAAVPVPPPGPLPTAGSPPVTDRGDLPDRIWTLPNALSLLRLLGVPVFLWLLLGPEEDGWAVAILMVSGFTDWLDGKLARWLDQSSRLGALLDPAADRLYIVSTLVALALREAAAAAGTKVLEPWCVVEVVVPGEYVGAVMSDLSARRARVTGSEADPVLDRTTVLAEVPEVELLTYPGVLRSVTHGTGSFSRRPLGYEPAPSNLAVPA